MMYPSSFPQLGQFNGQQSFGRQCREPFTYNFTDHWSAALTTTITRYITTNQQWSITPGVMLRYFSPKFSAWAGANANTTSGIPATITYTTYPYVESGTLFSKYQSASPYIGGTVMLPLSIYMSPQYTFTYTAYAAENIATSTTKKSTQTDPRRDTNHSLSLGLTKGILSNLVWLGTNYSYTYNKSVGCSDMSIYLTDMAYYTYDRHYATVTATLLF